jgi:hypothetical protein
MRPPNMMAGLVCLWLSRLLLGVGIYFDFMGTGERLSYAEHVRCMVRNHTQIKRGGRMTCWSDFPLQGVHRFESPRLSDMSNRLFVSFIT